MQTPQATLVQNPGVAKKDVQFVEGDLIPADLICGECRHLLVEPLRLECGHHVCYHCYHHDLMRRRQPLCPVASCHKAVNKIKLPAESGVIRQLTELRIYCPRREHGCDWQGVRGQLATHTGGACNKMPCAHAAQGCTWRGTAVAALTHLAQCAHAPAKKEAAAPLPAFTFPPSSLNISASSASTQPGAAFPAFSFAAPMPSVGVGASVVATGSIAAPASLASAASATPLSTIPSFGTQVFTLPAPSFTSPSLFPQGMRDARGGIGLAPTIARFGSSIVTTINSDTRTDTTAPTPLLDSLAPLLAALPAATATTGTPMAASRGGALEPVAVASPATPSAPSVAPAAAMPKLSFSVSAVDQQSHVAFGADAQPTPLAHALTTPPMTPPPATLAAAWAAPPAAWVAPPPAPAAAMPKLSFSPQTPHEPTSPVADGDTDAPSSLSAFLPASHWDNRAPPPDHSSTPAARLASELPPLQSAVLSTFPLAHASDALGVLTLPTDLLAYLLDFIPTRPRLLVLRRLCKRFNNAVALSIRMRPAGFIALSMRLCQTRCQTLGDELWPLLWRTRTLRAVDQLTSKALKQVRVCARVVRVCECELIAHSRDQITNLTSLAIPTSGGPHTQMATTQLISLNASTLKRLVLSGANIDWSWHRH